MANNYDQRVFGLKIPDYYRSRGVFNQDIRLSTPALIKVIEILQIYNLSDSNTDVKGRAFQNVLIPSIRSGMGQYFTPENIADFMVKIIQPSYSDLILDPFCGSGRFLSSCLRYLNQYSNTFEPKNGMNLPSENCMELRRAIEW